MYLKHLIKLASFQSICTAYARCRTQASSSLSMGTIAFFCHPKTIFAVTNIFPSFIENGTLFPGISSRDVCVPCCSATKIVCKHTVGNSDTENNVEEFFYWLHFFFVFSLACRDCNEFHKNRMYKLMYKLMTSMEMENHRKMNYDSKYVNLYTIIFTFHALFMDYTGGTLLMCFSILTDVDNSQLMMMYNNNILTSVQ